MNKPLSLIFILSLSLLASGISHAEEGKDKGFDVAARSDRSDLGFKSSKVDMTMILQNSAGKTSTRKMFLMTLEKPNEDVGDKSLIIFKSPADINGTALLSHAKILDADNQWLYLPALKRIKRISSANKSGPFVGSEFSFEDFTALELNKFSYKYIKSEACDTFTCDVVERYPEYDYSGYTKQVTWVDQTHFQVRKVEFYDRRGDLLKTLELSDYRVYKDGFWRAHNLSMVNHKTNKKTDLVYSSYEFDIGLSDRSFNKSILKRIR